MSTKQVTYCDNCQKPKGETNHWYYVEEGPGYFTVSLAIEGPPPLLEGNDEPLDVCGEECVSKLLQKWMGR